MENPINKKKCEVFCANDELEASDLEFLEEVGLHFNDYSRLLDADKVSSLLPKRKRNSHKGTYGRAAIVAGSARYTGAAYLATAACLRAGAGYTALFTPSGILPHYMLKTPEALLCPICEGSDLVFNEENFVALLSYDSIAYGMGMGVSKDVADGARYLLEKYAGKLIIDADGLNSLAKYERENFQALFCNKKCDVVLTPHVKEFSRLSGKKTEEIIKDGLFAATDFASKYAVNVLLKNAVSIITNGREVLLNTAGTPGQAKGGSGDVLSGAIAGLCASGLSTFDGACAAAYVVGKAAELACEKISTYSLIATDVIAYMGASFLKIIGE